MTDTIDSGVVAVAPRGQITLSSRRETDQDAPVLVHGSRSSVFPPSIAQLLQSAAAVGSLERAFSASARPGRTDRPAHILDAASVGPTGCRHRAERHVGAGGAGKTPVREPGLHRGYRSRINPRDPESTRGHHALCAALTGARRQRGIRAYVLAHGPAGQRPARRAAESVPDDLARVAAGRADGGRLRPAPQPARNAPHLDGSSPDPPMPSR